jgi:hypothetical protein
MARGQNSSKLKVAGSNPAGVATAFSGLFQINYLGTILSSRVGRLDNSACCFVLLRSLNLAIACSARRSRSATAVYRCTSLKVLWPVTDMISCVANRRNHALLSPEDTLSLQRPDNMARD